MQRVQALQNGHLGSNRKIPRQHVEIDSTNTFKQFCGKNRPKKAKYFSNETFFKTGHRAEAIAFAEWLVVVQNINSKQHAGIDSLTLFKQFCAKNRLKIFQKCHHFETRPPCKGYNLAQNGRLKSKIKKKKKTCKNRFYNHIKLVLCNKKEST